MNQHNPLDLTAQAYAEQQRHDLMDRDAKRHRTDIDWLMSQPAGRRIMWNLLGQAGVFKSSFTGDNVTFFNEGQRNMGLIYLNLIMESCPDQYAVMAKEAADQRKDSNAE